MIYLLLLGLAEARRKAAPIVRGAHPKSGDTARHRFLHYSRYDSTTTKEAARGRKTASKCDDNTYNGLPRQVLQGY